MKKIITEKVGETAEYYCDKHPDRVAASELKTASWYGSRFDLLAVEAHLCDECIVEMFKLIEERFGVTPKEIEI
jgi:hypothetical protein